MPRPPGIIDRVSYVVEFLEDPCEAPWTVYLELALPAAGEAFMALFIPSPDEIIENYLAPGGARSRGKFRRGKGKKGGRIRRLGFVPDVDELIADRLPFRQLVKARNVGRGVRFLWTFHGVLERALWYWMVVDMTTQFAYQWTSAVAKSEYCQADLDGAALVTKPFYSIQLPFAWTGPGVCLVEKSRGTCIGSNAGSVHFTASGGSVQGGCNVQMEPDVDAVQVALVRTNDMEVLDSDVFDQAEEGSEHSTVLVYDTPKANESYAIFVRTFHSGGPQSETFITNYTLNAFGANTHSGTPEG